VTWKAKVQALLADQAQSKSDSPMPDDSANSARKHRDLALDRGYGDFGNSGAARERTVALDERAAIIEVIGGVPREWVTAFTVLLALPPPAGAAPEAWQAWLVRAGRTCDRQKARMPPMPREWDEHEARGREMPEGTDGY
jgi:hypothetical protein